VEWGRKTAELDYTTGGVAVDDLTELPRIGRSFRWLLVGRTQILVFRRWLAARAGRLVPLWLPSFQSDLIAAGSMGSGSDTLEVVNCGWLLSPKTGRRDVQIKTAAGALFYRRVTEVEAVSPEVERLRLDSALGQSVGQGEFERISFLTLARLDTDAVELAFVTDELVQVTARWRGVRDDDP
jgi:hypothetical protein